MALRKIIGVETEFGIIVRGENNTSGVGLVEVYNPQ